MKNKPIKIIPRGDWVLVRPVEMATKNEHGLIIPESVEREAKAQGKVIRVGPRVKDLKVGATVLYGKYAGEEIQLANKQEHKERVDFVLLLNDDILAEIL